ncbi:hypothetical protein TrRE_jg6285, partial [Triparma retinervis]
TDKAEDAQELKLFLAQLHVNEGRIQEALDVLEEEFGDFKFEPAVVKTRIDLYSQLESPKADTLLDDILASSEIGKENARRLLISKGEYLLACSNFESAAEIFKGALDGDGGEMEEEDKLSVISLLVQAYSRFDVDKAMQYANELPASAADSLPASSPHGGGEGLEFAALPRSTARSRAASALLAVNTDVERNERRMKNRARTKEQREKRRERHVAKLEALGKYNPNNPPMPDPERWLPKSQRSHSKKGRKNRDKFSGAQGAGGGALKDAAKLDAKKRAEGGDKDARAFSTAHLAVGGKKSRRR